MGGAFPSVPSRPARASGPVALWAAFSLSCALLSPAANAGTDAHAETVAALADTQAAIAEIVHAQDQIINSPNPYHLAARRAINAIVGKDDPLFDRASGTPGDALGAIGHVDRVLDRRGNPPWTNTLHGVEVNLRAGIARLRDALEERQMEDFQFDATAALLNLKAAVGQPTRNDVFGGLEGALATTSLGVPAGARQVSACKPASTAPAYGLKDDYLAFVAVPAAAGTASLPEDFGSRDVRVEGDRLIVHTAAAGIVAKLCGAHAATASDPPPAAEKADPPQAAAPKADPPPALYTRAQARAGKRVFLQHCSKCHGKNLQGSIGPAIAGTQFLKTAHDNHWSMYIIRYVVVNTMPLHEPGSLSKTQYADVLSYILASNCFPAGDKPFPLHDDPALQKIELAPLAGAHVDNRKFGTCKG